MRKTPKVVRQKCIECDIPDPVNLHDPNHFIKAFKGRLVEIKKAVTDARPIIALYDQTQDAVGGGGSNSSPSQPLVTSRLHRKQAADSNARTTPSIVRSRGSNFRNHIIKSAYQIGDAPCDEQTKVATVANQGHISVTLQ